MKKLFFLLFILLIHPYFDETTAFSFEPSLQQLQTWTLRYAQLENEEIRRWKRKSRLSHALPRVMVGYDQKYANQINNTIQDSISVTSAGVTLGPPEASVHQDNNLNQGFEVKAYWDFNELLFSKDELNISAEARHRIIMRSEILEELREAYFERKKLLLRNEHKNPGDYPILLQFKLEELNAKLDALTGGKFSDSLQNSERSERNNTPENESPESNATQTASNATGDLS